MLFFVLFGLYLAGTSAFVLPPLPLNSGRIVGGIETTIEDRPFSVALLYLQGSSYRHNCGASILSKKYLLSAAQCKIAATYYGRVGSTSNLVGGQLVSIQSNNFEQHPKHFRPTLDYDVAVLKVDSEIVFSINVQPVSLPISADPVEGDMVTVSGWGATSETDTARPENIRKVDLPTWSNEKCESAYFFITRRQICLGGTPQGGTGACFGDSGGPAIYRGVQVGLSSGGNGCAAPNVPGIYARISTMLDWIKEKAELN